MSVPILSPRIGTLRESHLHAALKQQLAQPGDLLEAPVGGFVADLVRGAPGSPGRLIVEVQTGSFAALRRKLPALLAEHRVQLVHPIAVEKWIVRVDRAGRRLSRRKSPRRGALTDLFLELVSLPALVAHPNLSVAVALIHEEEWRTLAARKRRRGRAYRVVDRRLLQLLALAEFRSPADFLSFLPAGLAQPFTSRGLAEALGVPEALAHKMTYCLRHMGALAEAGRLRRARLYVVPASAAEPGGPG